MRLHDDTTPRLIFGVAAYALVAMVLCAAAIFGFSRLLAAPQPGKAAASRAPARTETTGAASRKETGRDTERRPAWISPTPKYQMGPSTAGARAREAARSGGHGGANGSGPASGQDSWAASPDAERSGGDAVEPARPVRRNYYHPGAPGQAPPPGYSSRENLR